MLIACVLIKHFSFQVEAEAMPHLAGREVLLISREGKTPAVAGTSPAITDVPAGTPLSEALARHPLALQREADLPAYRRRFDEVLDALEAVSPLVEENPSLRRGSGQALGSGRAELGCAYVGLDGLAELYGGMTKLLQALQEVVSPRLEPRFGIGPGRFPATVAASAAQPGQILKAPPTLIEFLAPYPVEVLPVPWETVARLKRLGLTALGDIARQKLGPMETQFGPGGRSLWEMARGIDNRPIFPRQQELSFEGRVDFPVATVSLETIYLAVENLLVQLYGKPELWGRYARLALLRARVSRRPTWERKVAFKEAAGSAQTALRMIKHAISLYPPSGPVEDLSITLHGVTGEAGRQTSLWTDVRRQDQLRETLRQLEARLGVRPPIYQYRDAEPWSRIPERRRVLIELSL